MHEEALVADLRRKLRELSEGLGGLRITNVTVRIGSLAHLKESGLRARWPEIVGEEPLRGARLELVPGPGAEEAGAGEVRIVSVDVEEPAEASGKSRSGVGAGT